MRNFIALCLLLLPLSLAAELDMQFRYAGFAPQDETIRDLYGDWLSEYEWEISTPLGCDWSAFINASYYSEEKDLPNAHTSMSDWAAAFGIKRYLAFDLLGIDPDYVSPYLGIGIGPAYVKFHNFPLFAHRHPPQLGIIVLGKAGIEFDFYNCLFLDFFADYSYQWFRFRRRITIDHQPLTFNGGGLKLGIGIGYRF